MEKYILAIDQGTTCTKVILYDSKGEIQGNAYREIERFYPSSGWVKYNPEEAVSSVQTKLPRLELRTSVKPLFTGQRTR